MPLAPLWYVGSQLTDQGSNLCSLEDSQPLDHQGSPHYRHFFNQLPTESTPVQEMQETWVRSLGWEYPLEEEMATGYSIFAWKILQRSLAGYSPWG